MRQKQKHRKLSPRDAEAIVRGFHVHGETQSALARRYNVNSGYISRLCHGDARPEIYQKVSAECSRSDQQ